MSKSKLERIREVIKDCEQRTLSITTNRVFREIKDILDEPDEGGSDKTSVVSSSAHKCTECGKLIRPYHAHEQIGEYRLHLECAKNQEPSSPRASKEECSSPNGDCPPKCVHFQQNGPTVYCEKHNLLYQAELTREKHRSKEEKVVEVTLRNSHKKVLIDAEDRDKVEQFNWSLQSDKEYAVGGGTRMHRLITNCPPDLEVDHINGNGLDNRKSNLRICTRQENIRNTGPYKNNTSGYKGVYWDKVRGMWQAKIWTPQKLISIGYFSNKEDAAKAWNEKAKELHGEFARLNEVPGLDEELG